MAPCILCIEDEATLLADLVEELTAAGYQVISASCAEQALALLEQHHPALVLCDVMLGGEADEDGYFIHQHIRERRPDLATTPFIFLTALGHRSAILKAKREGIDDYLVKPVDYDMLLATISSRLAQVGRLRGYRERAQDALLGRMKDVFAQLPGAVLLCDQLGNLLFSNLKAQQLSREKNLWRTSAQGRLLWPNVTPSSLQTLQQYLGELSGGQSGDRRVLVLERRNASEPVLVSILKLDAGVQQPEEDAAQDILALFLCPALSRPLPDLGALRLLFGLTQSEARVALLLAQGMRTDEVALALGVSASTIAFHLRNLFSKTGVARQTDIVALVLAAGWSIPDLSRPAGES